MSGVPHVRHVFIVVLENEDAAATFGDNTEIPYLAKTLTSEGAYVPNYYATGHLSLDNYISMVSGQAPNPTTQADCPVYTDFAPGPRLGRAVRRTGLHLPARRPKHRDPAGGQRLHVEGLIQDMANSAPAQPSTCRHPAFNSPDGTQAAEATDQYAARHNPFVYFHSIIDFPTCQANDVDLSRLAPDLQSESTTPNYAFITPTSATTATTHPVWTAVREA